MTSPFRQISRSSVSPALLWGCLVCALPLLLSHCGEKNRTEPPTAAASKSATHDIAAFSGENAHQHALELCALGPRPSGSEAYARQIDYLETQLRAAGWRVQRDDFLAPNGTPMINLRAVHGEANATRPLLISCHIDTKRLPGFLGADDGASAAGLMAELARVLAEQPDQAAHTELIFLDGEEAFGERMTDSDGLYGSRFDVARRRKEGQIPRFQINLDMVGGADNVIAIPAEDTSDFMLSQYAKAILEENLPPQRWRAIAASYRDDHRPYLEAGVDALNLIADFRGTSWWHRQADTPERLSPRMLDQAGRLTLRLIRRLSEH